MVTKFASRPHAWRLVSIGIGGFRYTVEKRHTKACQYFVTLDLIPSNARQECVATALTICLFSGLRSSLLCTDLKVCVSTVCVGDMRVSLVQVKGRQHHLSENIGPAIAGSARPAPPALSERNKCVKETVPLNYSRFKVQA